MKANTFGRTCYWIKWCALHKWHCDRLSESSIPLNVFTLSRTNQIFRVNLCDNQISNSSHSFLYLKSITLLSTLPRQGYKDRFIRQQFLLFTHSISQILITKLYSSCFPLVIIKIQPYQICLVLKACIKIDALIFL